MDGNVDPLSVHIRCKAVVKALESIIERTEELAKDTAATYGKGEFKFHGASVQLREPRDMPDFTQDPTWVELNERIKARQELIKTAFKMASTAAIVDPNTGEVVPVVPVKPAKTTLTVTFK
jgi:hypothetical protein